MANGLDKQFCKGVVCSYPIDINTVCSLHLRGSCYCRYACDSDRHEQRLPMGQSCKSLIKIEAQTSIYTIADSAQAVYMQVPGHPFLCEQKVTRPIHTTTHWHHWVCQRGGSPLSVKGSSSSSTAAAHKTSLWHTCTNRLPHTIQTQHDWDMRHTHVGYVCPLCLHNVSLMVSAHSSMFMWLYMNVLMRPCLIYVWLDRMNYRNATLLARVYTSCKERHSYSHWDISSRIQGG